ncbi:LysR family transcriptional regulator [Belnapia sp. T18]|uniref:LysR family transcriptional regulator n=1 Tax=Belnapia arida TaxID=2804533 RepID=A0ABS1UAS3_9PROT|nr:LysR family transcriptional regulator [Belnapia arida]MBL6081220.1 LysR family transcriptional regulator [Belnapia arida]
MDRLQAMETFTRVVEAGGFKRAAETLGVLPSTVTKTIKDLEAHLGVQLLNRTTRALSITNAGLRYYDSSKAILREVEAAEGVVVRDTGTIRGTIRAGMPPSLARHFIIPALPRFTVRFPDIEIDLQLGDAVVDLVQQGIDCVIRAGEPEPSSLILRRLGAFRWYMCASPAYLERHGQPREIADLCDHLVVGYADSRTGRPSSWAFQDGDQLNPVSLKTRVTVNDTDAYVAAGIAGLGLIRVASYMVRRPLTDGRLVRIVPHLETPPVPVSLLYPQSRHLSTAVRAFIDWCIELIASEAKSW